MASSHLDCSAVLAFVLGLLPKISPSVFSGASVSIYCSRRGLLELQQGLQHAHPSSAGPQPAAADAFYISKNLGGGTHIPCHLTASSLLTCAREQLRRAGEPLSRRPALPAKGELISTAPTPARAHAQQRQSRVEGSPPESPANYTVSR